MLFNSVKTQRMSKCKICDKPANAVFNIELKPVSICEFCANAIFIQQAAYFVEQKFIIESTDKKEINEKG